MSISLPQSPRNCSKSKTLSRATQIRRLMTRKYDGTTGLRMRLKTLLQDRHTRHIERGKRLIEQPQSARGRNRRANATRRFCPADRRAVSAFS